MSFMENAKCAMCNRSVHFEAGRIACDGCNLPTDCCLCEYDGASVAPPEPPIRPAGG